MRSTYLLPIVALLTGMVLLPAQETPENSEPHLDSVRIDDVPHVRQKPDFCGEACVEMVLRKLGKRLDQDDVFDQSGLAPELGRGCYTRELATAVKRLGFDAGRVWSRVASDRAERDLHAHFQDLHADLRRGVPSIVCMRYDDRPETTEHFRLILGFDAETDEVLYHEPAEARGAYRRMPRRQLLSLWPLKYDPQSWTLVRIRLEPQTLVDVRRDARFTNADYAQHIRRLKTKLPGDDFHLVLQEPFVVVGDESAATVQRRASATVKWAVDRIKRDYFGKDPDQIIDIWLFKDKASYEKHTRELFGEKPGTPFGYYSPRHRALVMNISTGGGTLVHEIVHPFMAANFPDCPAWFNEGLASLYEQCRDKDGRIWGSTNWRLRGLQQAIDRDRVPPFEKLCSTSTHEFYNQDPGTNYAQARYLCYYLQEKSLLRKYYREFQRHSGADPTGLQTLKKFVGNDLGQFQREWEAYVEKLRF